MAYTPTRDPRFIEFPKKGKVLLLLRFLEAHLRNQIANFNFDYKPPGAYRCFRWMNQQRISSAADFVLPNMHSFCFFNPPHSHQSFKILPVVFMGLLLNCIFMVTFEAGSCQESPLPWTDCVCPEDDPEEVTHPQEDSRQDAGSKPKESLITPQKVPQRCFSTPLIRCCSCVWKLPGMKLETSPHFVLKVEASFDSKLGVSLIFRYS